MRLAWQALGAWVLLFCWGNSACADPLALHECRLEHPLDLASIAARCGTLAVPEDPRAPGGRKIDLFVAVVPALDRRAVAAPLFLLAGGPGQAAVDLYTSTAGAFSRANRTHALVLVDQRGTGRSSPLTCSYPEDWQDLAAALPELRRATSACLARYGDRVRFYTTSVAVEDLERVRVALGYGPIDLYASSYGTRVAELYMRKHPASTHAVVLDGVLFPEEVIGPDTPLDGERALDLIVARCAAAADCAAAYPRLAAELRELRRRFGPEKVALELADPTTGAPMNLDFDRGVLAAALRFLSYDSTQASLLPALIHEGAAGRLAPLAAETLMLARQVRDQLASAMQNSVICSEDAPYFELGSPLKERLAQTYQGTDQLEALIEICRLWPKGPVDPGLHRPLKSAVPTLLLSGEADPVTPPAAAERLARGLSRQRHFVLAGEGHGQIVVGCVPGLLAEFLDAADPRTLDASCLKRHRAAPFFVSLTGPAP